MEFLKKVASKHSSHCPETKNVTMIDGIKLLLACWVQKQGVDWNGNGAEKQPRGDGVPPPMHRHVDEQEKNSSTNGKNEEYRSWEKKVELLSFEGQDLWAGLLEPKNFGCGTLSQQRRFR